jgi:hypothetical protein
LKASAGAIAARAAGLLLSRIGELGPDRLGLGAFLGFEDVQRLMPDRAGSGVVTGVLVRIAQAAERERLEVPMAELAEYLERRVEAGDRLGVVPETVMCVAEAVPGVAEVRAPALRVLQVDGLFAVGDGALVVAEQDLDAFVETWTIMPRSNACV